MEDGPVRIHITHGRLTVPIGHRALRGNDALQCPGRCSGTVATNAKCARAAIGKTDAKNSNAVSPGTAVDIVDKAPRLKIGEVPAYEFCDAVGTASSHCVAAERLPSPATCGAAGCSTACGPNKGALTRELNRQSSGTIPG